MLTGVHTRERIDVAAQLAWAVEITECGVKCGCLDTALVLLLGGRELTRITLEFAAGPSGDERDDMISWAYNQGRLVGAQVVRYFEGPLLTQEASIDE